MSILQQGSRSFYTYFHCRLDDGKIFYVGKGTRDRYKSKSGRNVHWQRVARKHGFTAHIIAEWETEKEAFDHEQVIIESLLAMNAPLTNIILDGGGIGSYVRSAATVQKAQALATAAKQKPEVRARMSISAKERFKNQAERDKVSKTVVQRFKDPEFYASYEKARLASADVHRKNLRAARSKAFTCVEVGRSFKILADAVVWLRSIGKINADYGGVHNALTGRQKTAYGYHWSYLEQK